MNIRVETTIERMNMLLNAEERLDKIKAILSKINTSYPDGKMPSHGSLEYYKHAMDERLAMSPAEMQTVLLELARFR